MKRTLISLLTILLALCTLLVSCNETPPANEGGDPNGTPKPPAGDGTYVKTENYIPADVFAQMKAYFDAGDPVFATIDRAYAPFVSTDVFALSDCKLNSITIPVFSTRAADENGDFTFSLYVLPNAWAALCSELTDLPEPIVIKINAAEYGLEENKVNRKLITVDLTEYSINLSKSETLGFASSDDTLVPAQVVTTGTHLVGGVKDKSAAQKCMIDDWGAVGYYQASGSGGLTYVDDSLFFDFEVERTYKSETAYNEMIAAAAQAEADYAAKIAALKAVYNGKSISVLGDSISTFNTVSTDKNLGLGDNPPYSKYTLGATVYSPAKTYWGKLAAETGMSLNVINSWGSGKVYGWDKKTTSGSFDFKDAMLRRSYNLSQNGQSPDVILLSYGINDMGGSYSSIQSASSSKFSGNMPTGDLYQRLTAAGKTKTDKEIVAEWFAEVEAYATQHGFDPEDPATITFNKTNATSDIYTCWEAAYALSVRNILRLHPNAEIYCISLPDRNHDSSTQPRLDKANLLIRALAEYFEITFIDQAASGVNRDNSLMYGSDGTGLHPNGKGHAALTRAIVDVMYEKLPK